MSETGRNEPNPSAGMGEAPAARDEQLRSEVWNHIQRSRELIERSQRIIEALRSIDPESR